MHIKQITISNFRSFRQQPEIQPFLPGMNAVVGRNGSGKSNLFDAVQFCLLAPRFANLRQVRGLHPSVVSCCVKSQCVSDTLLYAYCAYMHTYIFLRTHRKNAKRCCTKDREAPP